MPCTFSDTRGMYVYRGQQGSQVLTLDNGQDRLRPPIEYESFFQVPRQLPSTAASGVSDAYESNDTQFPSLTVLI